MSWSMRALDSDAQASAVQAAERAGMPVDEWLNSVVRETTAGAAGPRRGADRVRDDRDELHDRVARLHESSAVGARPDEKDNVAEIANALSRLLAEEGVSGKAAPRRDRVAQGAPRRPAMPQRREQRETSGAQERTERVERVLAALGKLDERVRNLSARSVSDGYEIAGADRDPIAPPPGNGLARDRFERPEPAREDFRAEDRERGDPHVGKLQAAIAEISQRRDTLQGARADHRRPTAVHAEPTPRPRERYDTPRADQRTGEGGAAGLDIDRHFRDLAERIDSLREPRGAIADLRDEIAALRTSIERRERGGASDRDLRDIARMIASVERMQRDAHDPHMADLVRSEIADLRDAVMANNLDGAMKTLESGYAHIVERLDEVRRQIQDPAVVSVLERRLDDIERGLHDIPRATGLAGFDRRLDGLAHRLEDLSARHGSESFGHLESEMRALRGALGQLDVRDLMRNVDGQLRDLLERIDTIERTGPSDRDLHDRLTAFEDRLPARGALEALNHRMERISTMLAEDRTSGGASERVDDRLSEIVGRLDRIERQGANPGEFENLLGMMESGIERLAQKLERLEAAPLDTKSLENAISRLDATAERMSGGDRFAELQEQVAAVARSLENGGQIGQAAADISALRREVGEIRNEINRTDSLAAVIEPQIRELAKSLVTGDRLTTDDAALQRIEQQIAVIAGQLDATEERLSGLSDIEAALERIDGAIGAAGAPGQHAQSEGAAIAALRDDLKKLLDAADTERHEADGTMDRVQSALDTIVSRLSALENARPAPASAGNEPPAYAPALSAERTDSFEPRVDRDPRSERREPPALAADADIDISEDMPLEPGSGKPDLAALLRARQEDEGDAGTGDRKANFIAAARRAAQAAAAEIATSDEADAPAGNDRAAWIRERLTRSRGDAAVAEGANVEGLAGSRTEEKPASGRLGRLGRSLKLRRPVVLAAAAIILAIGALKVVDFTGTDPSMTGASDAPRVEGAPEAAPQRQVADAAGATSTPPTNAVPTAAPPASAPPAATPDEAVTFEPPAAEPGSFAGQGSMPPVGTFAKAPDTTQLAAPASAERDAAAAPTEAPAPGASTQTQSAGGRSPAAEPEIGLSAPMPDEATGVLALRVAAANGNPRAQFEVAVRYTEGDGVQADLVKAREWYERAAEGGLAPAQYRLGSMYEKGRGVAKDLESARKWYLRAADQGNIKAMHNLAVLLADGGLGKPDFTRAAHWFEKAAEHGVRDSQFNLGVLYARGLGVPANMVTSYKWFAIAANLGDSDAASKRDEIANSMQEPVLTEARATVEAWTPKPVDEAANRVVLDESWKTKPANSAAVGGTLVMQAQLLLGELGFDPGPADGVVGPKTVDAVRTFQLQAGMPVTGIIDPKLIKALAGRSI